MSTNGYTVVLAFGLIAMAPQPQADQARLAKQIASERADERSAAGAEISRIPVRNLTPALRAAVINALAREASLHVQADERRRRDKDAPPVAVPELIMDLSRIAIRLRDPAAIPALASAQFTGPVVPSALADFGELAAPAVIRVVASPDTLRYTVEGGLMSLRFMIEGKDKRPLSASTLDQIRQVAKQRLTDRQYFTVLWRAIDLAMVLDDPELTAIVASLAADSDAVVARGVTTPDLVEETQQRARDRLAGLPPKPRR